MKRRYVRYFKKMKRDSFLAKLGEHVDAYLLAELKIKQMRMFPFQFTGRYISEAELCGEMVDTENKIKNLLP